MQDKHMQGWIESAIRDLQASAIRFSSDIARIFEQLRAVQQGLTAAQQQGSNGGGSGGGQGAYSFMPGSSMTSGGNPPSGTPTSLTGQTVYQMVNGGWNTLSGTYTVYNGTPNTITSGLQCGLVPDGAGNFVIYFQSCN
jgi:hypothetical protein